MHLTRLDRTLKNLDSPITYIIVLCCSIMLAIASCLYFIDQGVKESPIHTFFSCNQLHFDTEPDVEIDRVCK